MHRSCTNSGQGGQSMTEIEKAAPTLANGGAQSSDEAVGVHHFDIPLIFKKVTYKFVLDLTKSKKCKVAILLLLMFIKRCIWGLFALPGQIVPLHSRSVTIFSLTNCPKGDANVVLEIPPHEKDDLIAVFLVIRARTMPFGSIQTWNKICSEAFWYSPRGIEIIIQSTYNCHLVR